MENIVAIIAIASLVCLAGYFVGRGARSEPPADLRSVQENMRLLTERVAQQGDYLSRRLEGIDGRMTETQLASQDLAKGIFDSLGDVRRATTTVAEQAREFTSLQDLLKPPKVRGGIGEAMLEELLRQVLPPQAYETQHRFADGRIVDAVVRAGGRIICIDSKFPLTNYARMCEAGDDRARATAEKAFAADVSKHMGDIADRYICPDEGTLDFAVMYVPAEGVYGEILRLSHRGEPLFEAAIGKRVMPMSPLTMYGYLQTILFGLKCLQIEKNAERILGYCGRLQQDFGRLEESYNVLGGHLMRARNQYEEGASRLGRFGDRLDRVNDLAAPDAAEDPAPPSLEAVND